jgi:N-methylhydantoinase B
MTVEPGTVISVSSSGGGGWGNPLERDPQRVLTDVQRGFVSREGAENEYGVVINGDKVDMDSTENLRVQMRDQASTSHFDYGPEREKYERTWTMEMYDALTRVLESLPVEWRFFAKGKIWQTIEGLSQNREVQVSDLDDAFEDFKEQFFHAATKESASG